MIRYTLACDAGHSFESWFPGSDAYDEQVARGLVTCPVCDSCRVGKTLMAPALARTDRTRRAGPDTEVGAAASGDAGPPPEAVPAGSRAPALLGGEPERRLRGLLRALREHVVHEAENVGPRLPEEARAMRLGEAPTRAIYGQASLAEARSLLDEGIELVPLPPAPDDRH